ncbi:MAG: hypothetical protein JXA54_08220 [Candidatus Heimdallarchaeota archaeon]|nr:hypothetical protein [Candidatus Heimdallarchaeota archaeon]
MSEESLKEIGNEFIVKILNILFIIAVGLGAFFFFLYFFWSDLVENFYYSNYLIIFLVLYYSLPPLIVGFTISFILDERTMKRKFSIFCGSMLGIILLAISVSVIAVAGFNKLIIPPIIGLFSALGLYTTSYMLGSSLSKKRNKIKH